MEDRHTRLRTSLHKIQFQKLLYETFFDKMHIFGNVDPQSDDIYVHRLICRNFNCEQLLFGVFFYIVGNFGSFPILVRLFHKNNVKSGPTMFTAPSLGTLLRAADFECTFKPHTHDVCMLVSEYPLREC